MEVTPAFWEDLAQRFQAIKGNLELLCALDKEIETSGLWSGERGAYRSSTADSVTWRLIGDSAKAEFVNLCRLTAAALGDPTGEEVSRWLDRFFEVGIYQRSWLKARPTMTLHDPRPEAAAMCRRLRVDAELSADAVKPNMKPTRPGRAAWVTKKIQSHSTKTVAQFAKAAGCDVRTIKDLTTTGNVRPDVLERVANTLGVSKSDIPDN